MKTLKLTLLLFTLFSATQFFAQNTTRDFIKEQKIEAQLKKIDSSIVKIYKEATVAMDQNNLKLADSLYSLVYDKAPTFDPAIRRLGIIKFQLGNTKVGVELCERAIRINETAYNLLSLAYCYFANSNIRNIRMSSSLLKKAQMLPDGDDPDILSLLGQIALEEQNIVDFRTITNEMLAKHKDLMITHYFAAILAAQDEEWKLAESEIQQAKKMGLQEEAVQEFLNSGVSSNLKKRLYGYYFVVIVIIWILGLFFLFIIGKLLSNFTLRSIEKHALSSISNKSVKILRPLYRLFMNIGGIYYYLSLPIILILVIALVVVLFYLFLYVGRIPIQLMAILVIGSCFTIYGMIRSLLVKVDYSDPGRKLEIEEAPELFKLAEEVANTIGTRTIDEIRITPTTDLAVYERGTWKDKFQDKAKRVLILGIGVLKDFNQSDFRAVLAHEYGHFSHRDTAGGDVALRVRNDMTKYFYALYSAGQNVWWNLAFQFLRLYNFIFLRISHGSTRLQEVLADNVAAKTYGKLAFQNGLTYVIKREIEFNLFANIEIDEAKKVDRPFNNLYELSGNSTESIDEELNNSLNRKTTEDDTHPSPIDRFRFISNVNNININYDSSKIRDLFLNWDSITHEMTKIIEDNVNKYR
ncbi:MAG: M48 family metalloprotease [Bacteroidales bacterium]|nr:M48 family metalloprotease [Bacteroidales bacterium]